MESSKRSSNLISPLLVFLLGFIFLVLICFDPWASDVFLLPKWTLFLFLSITFWVLFIVRIVYEDRLPRFSFALSFSLALFLFSTTISTLFSLHPSSSALFLGKVMAGSALAWLISCLPQSHRTALIRSYALFSLFVALYAILQKMHFDFVRWNDLSIYFRPAASSGNPVFLGAVMSIAFLIFWDWTVQLEKGWKCFPLLGMGMAFGTVAVSLSRGAYLSLALSAFFFLAFPPKRKEKLLLLIAAIALFSPLVYKLTRAPVYIEGQGRVTPLSRIQKKALSNKVRIVLWRDTAKLFQRKPVWGWGSGIFPLFYPEERGVEILRWQNITALPEDAHNLFFQMASTQGIFGVFTLLCLIFVFLFSLRFHPQKGFYGALFITAITPPLFQPWNPELFLFFFLLLGLPHTASSFSFSFPKRQRIGFLLIHVLFLVIALPLLLKPLIADTLYKKAMVYKVKEDYLDAIRLLVQAQLVDKDHLASKRELARVHRQAYLNKRDKAFLKGAIRLYRELIRLMPFDASLVAELGLAYSADIKDPLYKKKAIAAYKKAIAMDPQFALFHSDLGILYINLGMFLEARRELYYAIQLVPNFYEPYKNLSVLFHRMGKDDVALRYAKTALRLSHNDPDLYAQAALLLKAAGQQQQAQALAKKAYALKPSKMYRSLLSQIER